MEPEEELLELTERIRRSAVRHRGPEIVSNESLLRGELPPIPAKLPPRVAATSGASSTPSQPPAAALLETVFLMIQRARDKNRAPGGVPTIFRPFFRNQGGFNGVVVETLDRLAAANQQLRQQNLELEERLLALHKWIDAATQTQARTREWMTAADARLRSWSETRPGEIEARPNPLEENG